KYGKAEVPDIVKPITMADVAKRDAILKKAKEGKLVEKKSDAPPKSEAVRSFNVFVDNEYFNVEVDPVGGPAVVSRQSQTFSPATPASPSPAPAQASAPPVENKPAAKPSANVNGTLLIAPMPGMIVNYLKNVGDTVAKGETIVILEAMKMENALPSPCDGVIRENSFKSGDTVAKGAALSVIE
ncbi:MAG: biotin/lipoyl-containing protein, partial [Desulfopila sp.]|nr:biotin/lipoyl-containing protein [Desulfopila sp.]